MSDAPLAVFWLVIFVKLNDFLTRDFLTRDFLTRDVCCFFVSESWRCINLVSDSWFSDSWGFWVVKKVSDKTLRKKRFLSSDFLSSWFFWLVMLIIHESENHQSENHQSENDDSENYKSENQATENSRVRKGIPHRSRVRNLTSQKPHESENFSESRCFWLVIFLSDEYISSSTCASQCWLEPAGS